MYTGASLNPVRSFAPCVASGDFASYHWIYWIGPVLGGLVSGGYYHFVKYFNYWEANPGQDSGWTPPTSMLLQAQLPTQQFEAVGPVTPQNRRGHETSRRRNQTNSRERGIKRSESYPRHQYKQSWQEGENQYERGPRVEEGRQARGGHRFSRADHYDAGYSSGGTGIGSIGSSRAVRIHRPSDPWI